ncbi:MAG TPA: PAS domain-containing protein [Thermoanaerobaculia bacterium]|nr:PAS domain-containing protein [Thermoanaerobaculia bacterium]
MRTRLLGALLTILIFFALNLAVHVWGDRARRESLTNLQQGIKRQLLIAEIRERTREANREMALLAGALGGHGPEPLDLEARNAFPARVLQIGWQLNRVRVVPGSATPTAARVAAAWAELRDSWLRAYRSFGVNQEDALRELSLRADPLRNHLLTKLLPQWEQEESERAQATSREMRRVSELTEQVELLFFVLSALVVIAVALSVSRFMVEVNQGLEVRVKERTQELEAEILERCRVEEALRESEARYILAAQGANDGLWDWDLEKNEIYLSPRWKEMLGFGESDLSSSPHEWFERVHPHDLPKLQEALGTHPGGSGSHFECEHRMRHRDGSYRWMLSRGIALCAATAGRRASPAP